MAEWSELKTELQRWHDAGLTPTLWWRDDDAQQDSAELRRLTSLSRDQSIPLALAVIPRGCDPSLMEVLDPNPLLTLLQHGCAHENHAPAAERKCELGLHRPLAEILAELAQGRASLAQMFGPRFSPVLVPPWNRLCAELVEELPNAGFIGLSTLGPRGEGIAGLQQVNVHVDLINWREGRRFTGDQRVLAQLVEHLQMRRERRADPEEATGIMTHHLVHDELVWEFLARLFEFCRQEGVRWRSATSLFAVGTD